MKIKLNFTTDMNPKEQIANDIMPLWSKPREYLAFVLLREV